MIPVPAALEKSTSIAAGAGERLLDMRRASDYNAMYMEGVGYHTFPLIATGRGARGVAVKASFGPLSKGLIIMEGNHGSL